MSEDYYRENITKYSIMCDVCIELLTFDSNDEGKKNKIRRLKNELIYYSNYNRLKTIEREINKSRNTFYSYSDIGKKVLEIANIEEGSKEYEEYQDYISKIRAVGPKDYLIECLKKIIENEKQMKIDDYSSEEEVIEIPEEKIEDIIKRHVKLNNPYLEDTEIIQIKKQFQINFIEDSKGYLSNDTISKLFTIRIVNERLNRHEEISISSMIDTIEMLFELALTEMDYNRKSYDFGTTRIINYENALDNIQFIMNRNYAEEYDVLYEKLRRYYYKLSKEERERFNNTIKESKYISGIDKLPTPEEFTYKLNEKAKEKIGSFDKYINMDIEDAVEELSKPTKYMSANFLADYYHSIEGLNRGKLQEIFASLIERRMNPLDLDITEEEYEIKRQIRMSAICVEYLQEESMFTSIKAPISTNNYAKSRIDTEETKQKIYFRARKFKNSFKGIKYYRQLRKYYNEDVIADDEMQRIKKMF